jgi:hypothetical protein
MEDEGTSFYAVQLEHIIDGVIWRPTSLIILNGELQF